VLVHCVTGRRTRLFINAAAAPVSATRRGSAALDFGPDSTNIGIAEFRYNDTSIADMLKMRRRKRPAMMSHFQRVYAIIV